MAARRKYHRGLTHDVYVYPGKLEQLSTVLGLSHNEMVKKLGCTRTTYTKIKQGAPASGRFIASALAAFNCDFGALFYASDVPPLAINDKAAA